MPARAKLESDPSELLRAAGRIAGESSFEQFVRVKLASMASMTRDLEEVKAAVTEPCST